MHDLTAFFQAKPKLVLPGTLSWANLNPIPPKYRGRRRQRHTLAYSGPDSITGLQTSLNVLESIRAIRRHRWNVFDLQYPFLASLVLFSLYIAPSAPILKTLGLLGGALILLMPATRQFFFPALTIWVWLLYFFCSRFIPAEYRPHIWVRVLPALENVLYGANLSNILSAHTHPILDVLAWLPYGIFHFGLPLICSLIMFACAAPGTAPVFARSFGWMNILGVTIQLFFPCTPPWYETEHGLSPAAYGMPGSPAGLARVDKIFGFDMYTTNFTTAPLPFGAFPSLHSANAVLEALFMSYCFPRFRGLFMIYVGWIWWSTMYLSHHYAVDLVGGALIAGTFFYTAKSWWLPRRQPGKLTRWEYEYVEFGDRQALFDEEFASYALGLLEPRPTTDSDEWTVGSSSSFTSSSGSGSLSPALTEENPRQGMFAAEMTPNGSFWEGGDVGAGERAERGRCGGVGHLGAHSQRPATLSLHRSRSNTGPDGQRFSVPRSTCFFRG